MANVLAKADARTQRAVIPNARLELASVFRPKWRCKEEFICVFFPLTLAQR